MKSRTINHKIFSRIFLLSAFLLLTMQAEIYAAPLSTANPNTGENARKVLDYIASLPEQQENRVISGQHLGHGIKYTPDIYHDLVETLHNTTGKWIGMVGADYGVGSTPDEISVGNQLLIEHWNNGGLITIDYHVNNPWTGGSSWDLTSRNLVELITPGTAVNEVWMQELDKVATGLAELQDAGVVVLWRPFHEMNFTTSFWWDSGAHPGNPEPFQNMWRHMFNYFTYEKGLNNLLWVYAPADMDQWGTPVDFLYPGDDYVDIVGIDIYNDDVLLQQDGLSYNTLVATGKPFAFTEIGSYPTRDGSWNNLTIINAIRDRYPKTTYFLSWHSWTDNKVAIVDNQNAKALLDDPWVITRDELPDWNSAALPSPTLSPTSSPSPTPNEIIIDNVDAGFSTSSAQDVWQEYIQTDGQHYGSSHYYNGEVGTGQDTATWAFTVPESGNYDVYAWWWEGDWRPTDVPFTINHFDDSTTVRVDQRTNGGQWNLLGTFYFQDEGSVVVSDDVSSGQDIVADAIRLVYRSEGLPQVTPTPEPTNTPSPEPTPDSVTLDFDAIVFANSNETSFKSDQTLNMQVIARDVPTPGLYGVQFEINYDPTLISVNNLQPNPNLSFVVLKSVDNVNGKIRFVASQQGKVPGLTGDVTLLSFEATAVDTAGTVTFTFENEKMSDAQAQGFDVISEVYVISIGDPTTPEPTDDPTSIPTDTPTPTPTNTPTPVPTDEPTPEPTDQPTAEPTDEPTPEPTGEPAMANVSGQVILAGRAGNDWSGATVTIDGGQIGTTDTTGNFSIADVATGSLNSITADAPGYLPAVCTGLTVTTPDTSLTSVTLLSGDINDDKLVDITDATTVGASFGQTGSELPADITRDGMVDIFDIVLVSVNFGEEGPQTWNCLNKQRFKHKLAT